MSNAAVNIVKEQQQYATSKNLSKLFEDLTTALIFARPPDPAVFLSEECDKMLAQGSAYRAKPQNAAIDTEESAAAYWEEQRIRSLLEELFALTLHGKPADPLTFLKAESLKLKSLRSDGQPSAMFTDSDLLGMFSLFDPVSNNYITADQARTALRNLGIKDLSSVPEAGGTRLDSKTFLEIARAALTAERKL